MKTLILGVGNLLLGDEGVGVHAIRALALRSLPADAVAIETGTAFLDVLSEIAWADRILLIDAMAGQGVPGSVYRIPFALCQQPPQLASLHGLDLARVLWMAGNPRQPETVAFGVEPARIRWGMELSVEVQRALPIVVDSVYTELMRLPSVT